MKRLGVISLTLLIALLLFGCTKQFSGNMVSSRNKVSMTYRILEGDKSQLFDLEEGDVLDFDVVSESGKVDIVLQKDDEEAIYSGINIPTCSFKVTINEKGKYKCVITGHKAKGSINIVKENK